MEAVGTDALGVAGLQVDHAWGAPPTLSGASDCLTPTVDGPGLGSLAAPRALCCSNTATPGSTAATRTIPLLGFPAQVHLRRSSRPRTSVPAPCVDLRGQMEERQNSIVG